ncbi:P27 family phage terminase small subunit [Thioclava sp. BHET1]|nr:P27 family phage terminase small subunit [Thioclava sp. BHET1]
MKGAKPKLDNVIPMKGEMQAPVPDPLNEMSEEGRDVWRRLAPKIVAKGHWDDAYADMFAAYCEAAADFLKFTGEIAVYGSWYEVETRNGAQQKKRATWGLRQDALSTMNQLAARFGLTPVDAARLKAGGQGDLFDDLMAKLDGSD